MARDPRFLPGPAWVDTAWADAPVSPLWRRNLQAFFDAGRLRETGRICLLELTGPPSPEWADIALDGGCSGLVVPSAALRLVAHAAHRLPLLVRDPGDLAVARDLGVAAVADVDPALAAAFGLPVLAVAPSPLAAFVEAPTDGPGLFLFASTEPPPGAHGVRILLDPSLPDAVRIARLHGVQDALLHSVG